MDPTFARELRKALVSRAESASHRRRLARWRWGIGAVLALGLLGGGTAVAAQYFIEPGVEAHADLAPSLAVARVGSATIQLGDRPKGATKVSFELDPYDAGTYLLGHGGASVTVGASSAPAGDANWSAAPVDRTSRTSGYLELSQLDAGGKSFTITAPPGARWTARFTWVSSRTTPWGVNAAGQTYGMQNDTGIPDLIAVEATNGRSGYVFRTQLEDADGTTALRNSTSPQQNLEWQKENEGKRTLVPVYASDGVTRIGVFQVGQ
jgi:hypothetical protein